MRCQPYFATKTAAIVPSTKRAIAPRAIAPRQTITGSIVRMCVMRHPQGSIRVARFAVRKADRTTGIAKEKAIPDSVTRPTGSFCPARDLAILPRFRPGPDLRELPPSQVPAWPSGRLAHHEPPQARARSNFALRMFGRSRVTVIVSTVPSLHDSTELVGRKETATRRRTAAAVSPRTADFPTACGAQASSASTSVPGE